PDILVDLCLSWIVSIGRRGTEQPLAPLRVDLVRPAAHRAVLEAHFGCRVHFEAGRNALVFRSSELERPFVTHNADLLAMLGPQLDKELRARKSAETLAERVKATVKGLLAGRRPALQDV